MPEINYSALMDMAACRLNEKEFTCAVECAEYAIRHKRFLFEAHFIKGCALFYSGRYPEARSEFEDALGFAPGSEDCVLSICASAVKCGACDFERLAAKYKNNAGIAMLSAIALYESGRKEEAEAEFARVHELRPYYASAYADEGTLLLEDGEYDRAIACFDKALTLAPLNKYALYNRARAYLRKNEPERSVRDVEILMTIGAEDAGFLFLKAETDEALGKYAEAEKEYSLLAENQNEYVASESIKRLAGVKNKIRKVKTK